LHACILSISFAPIFSLAAFVHAVQIILANERLCIVREEQFVQKELNGFSNRVLGGAFFLTMLFISPCAAAPIYSMRKNLVPESQKYWRHKRQTPFIALAIF